MKETETKKDPGDNSTINEPIAIIGMSCRFPQAPNLETFWELLSGGKDTIREVPRERWDYNDYYDKNPDARNKTNQRHASMLDNIHDFDPLFFSISPAEATEMNPSQKLMLELSWEAIENSKQPLENFQNKNVGVYIGNIWSDFEHHRKHKNAVVTSHSAMGQSSNVIANRVSYAFGFTGPSLVVDTGCSSSLVALHLACQSLRDNSSELALVAGINHILDPDQYILLSKFGGLSSTGKCSAFDAGADGFVRGEGAGTILLKKLSDAERDGDTIYAVIRGSAINNNGANVSLPATSSTGQKQMLAEAYKHSGIAPHEIHYVEAHGTGTKLGDPNEARALGEFFRTGRKDNNLRIGSVKTNIGHLEAAAGIAGLIKVVLAMKHKKLPPSLNYKNPNPAIPFDELKLTVQNMLGDWPLQGRETLKAGINSFGWGGTNAHTVIEEYQQKSSVKSSFPATRRICLPISARSSAALKDYAKAYRDLFQSASESRFRDTVIASALLKPALDTRMLFSSNTKEGMIEALDNFIQQTEDVNSFPVITNNKTVMVFPGQGSQWLGMGKELLEKEPLFKAMITECHHAFKPHTDWSLLDQLHATEEKSLLDRIDVIQPMLFAMQVSLAKLWMSWGIKPDAVVGHSMGEVAAAYIAGALTLEDAAKVICTRSKLMRTVSGEGGTMATTALSLEEAERLIERYPKLSIAANNSAKSTVFSGDQEAITAMLAELESQDIFCRQIKVDVASHSQHMDPLKEKLRDALQDIKATPNSVPFYSTVVTGEIPEGETLTADYWVNNLRGTVQFRAAIDKLLNDEYTTFIEVSPHPALVNGLNECIQSNNKTAHVISSGNKNKPEHDALYQNFGELYSRVDVDWKRFYGMSKAPAAELPSYPFQRQRYELEVMPNTSRKSSASLIGEALHLADSDTCFWESTISLDDYSFLRDHCVNEDIVLPGALYVEMALEAAHELFKTGTPAVSQMHFLKSVTLTQDQPVTIQLKMQQKDRTTTVEFFAKAVAKDGKPAWDLLAKGALRNDRAHTETVKETFPTQEYMTTAPFYESLTPLGLNYGPIFQNVHTVHTDERDEKTIHVTIRACDTVRTGSSKYKVHPALLDSIFQPMFFNLASEGSSKDQFTSFLTDIDECRYFGAIDHNEDLHCVVKLKPRKDERRGLTLAEADINVYKTDGTLALKVRGLKGKVIDTAFIVHRNEKLKDWLYSVQWVRAEHTTPELVNDSSHWVVFGDPYGVSEILIERMERAGLVCTHILPGVSFAKINDNEYTIHYGNSDDYNKLINALFADGGENIKGILHAGSMSYTWQDPYLTADHVEEQQVYGSISFMHLHQQLAKLNLDKLPKLVILTNGIHAVGHGHQIAQPVHSPLWGMVKVIFNELTHYQCRYFDLSANPMIEELDQIVDEIRVENPQENEVAVRGIDQFVPRLGVPSVANAPSTLPTQFSSTGTYVVTGYRGLGFVFIEWMIRQGARNFALISRSGDAGKEVLERMEVLESQGCRFERFKADTGNYTELKNTLEEIERTMTSITGVVHAAGVIEARKLVDLNPDEFLQILNPKVKGAWNLHLLTLRKPLDCFILFSSASTLIGLSGQGSYVAANAFLDTLAHSRRHMGLAGMSVNWGVMKDVGMVANKAELERYARAEGFEPVAMQDAMEVFNLIYEAQYTQIGIVKLDPESMANYYSALRDTKYFSGLLRKENTAAQQQNNFAETFTSLPSHEERAAALEQLVVRLVAEVAKTPVANVKTGMTFQKLGFDSLMAVQLWNQFELNTGLKLPLSVFWKYPVIQNCIMFMCRLLEEKLLLQTREAAGNQPVPASKPEWFVIPEPNPDAAFRVFCFHDAGGNTSLYQPWKDISDDVELVLVELPGRSARSEEKPYTNLASLLNDLLPELLPMLDKPFCFFGHSMGGVLAFEVARALRRSNKAMPSKIFISSAPQLATYRKRDVDHTMDDDTVAAMFPNLSRENITDETLRKHLIGILRADLLLLSNYQYVKEAPLSVDLVVVHGSDDDRVSRSQAEEWKHETTSSIKIITRQGGHRYIEHDTAFLTGLIGEEIAVIKTTVREYERVS